MPPPGLAVAITAPRVYKAAALPAGPSPEDLRRLLATTAGDRPADLRDRALLLALSVYGLRAGEARALGLDDINWEAETLRVRRPGRDAPLGSRCPAASERPWRAICVRSARALTPGRSSSRSGCPCDRSALPRSAASYAAVCAATASNASVPEPTALRHAFAQRLLDEGFSMEEIGDCLGHRSPAATAVYAKVDLAGLRQVVADFDLEGFA